LWLPGYCLSVTLRGHLRKLAGVSPRAVLESFAAIQMVDAISDNRWPRLISTLHELQKDQEILLAQLGWELPSSRRRGFGAGQARRAHRLRN